MWEILCRHAGHKICLHDKKKIYEDVKTGMNGVYYRGVLTISWK